MGSNVSAMSELGITVRGLASLYLRRIGAVRPTNFSRFGGFSNVQLLTLLTMTSCKGAEAILDANVIPSNYVISCFL